MAHAASSTCDACHDAPADAVLLSLQEIGGGEEERHNGAQLTLCADCLRRREPQAWSRREPQGRALWYALEERRLPLWGRFRYFADEAEIHLLRVDHDWAHARAAAPSA